MIESMMATPQRGTVLPLSPAQQGMLFHVVSAPQTGAYVTQTRFSLRGEIDAAAMQRAWQDAVNRHPVLRTSFHWDGDDGPVQVIHEEAVIHLAQHDLRDLPAARRDEQLGVLMQADREADFDLSRPPLIRLHLVRMAGDRYELVWTIHHLVLDARSGWLVRAEVFDRYVGFRQERLRPPRSRPPFAAYIAWLQAQDLSPAKAYWRQEIAGFTAPTPLPAERGPRPVPDQAPGKVRSQVRLSLATTRRLQELAHECGATTNTLVLGAWAVLLSRHARLDDVTFGLTVSDRPSGLAGAGAIIGPLINTLPLRVRLADDPPLRVWLPELRRHVRAIVGHAHTPLPSIQEWSGVSRRLPLFESIVVFETYSPATIKTSPDAGVQFTGLAVVAPTHYPLTVVVERMPEMVISLDHDTARIDTAAAAEVAEQMRTLLEGMAATPDGRLSALPLLTDEGRRRLLAAWSSPGPEYPADRSLAARVAEQVERAPDAVAVVCDGEMLSYRELNERANQVAHHLRALGVGPEVVVGVALERSLDLVIGLLGVLKAGGAYLPLDPGHPPARLAAMVRDAGAAVVLTRDGLMADPAADGARVVCLDRDREGIARQPRTDPDGGAAPDHLAYVIYTSGSTGTPKGVMVTHRNVTRLFRATEQWFHFDERDVWTLFHSYAFDFSVWEIWGALCHGGRLVVVPHDISRSPDDFLQLLCRERVTVLNQTPSAFYQLMGAEEARGVGQDLAVRLVILGGEKLEVARLRSWFERHGDRQPELVNMYGITEATVHATYRPLRRADLDRGVSSPIGRPLPDLQLYVLDARVQPVPAGVPGELYLGGAGIARGYLARPELTAERFIPNPFDPVPGGCLYRTGDLVRTCPDGELEYLGRIDRQVKLRGFRIEPGEIEALLRQHPAVRDVTVRVREDDPGEKRLVAYVVPAGEQGLARGALRSYLAGRLPDYMIPSAFVAMDALPLTPHGKLDADALPDPGTTLAAPARMEAGPRNLVERYLQQVWAEVLRVDRVGMYDNFFDLGGHSLLAMQLVGRIERDLGKRVPVTLLFTHGTVAAMGEVILPQRSEPLSPVVTLQAEGRRPPFFWFCGMADGPGFYARKLVQHLDRDQPFHVLRPLALRDRPAPETIEALAALHIDVLRSVQPTGPYRFGGYCQAGVVAFEAARQLHQQGGEVELVVLLHSVLPRVDWARYVKLSSMLGRLSSQSDLASHHHLFSGSGDMGFVSALAAYRPGRYAGRVTILAGAEARRMEQGRVIPWEELAQDVDVRIVPGDHDTVLAHTPAIAATLQDCLRSPQA